MDLTTIERWLLPADMEGNERFQSELLGLSSTGLRMLGVMELTIALFLLPGSGGASWHFLSVVIVGLSTVAVASVQGIRRRARVVAICSGLLTAAALMQTTLWIRLGAAADDHLLFGDFSLLLFAVISAVPLIPLQTCAFGCAIGVLYGITAPLAGAWDGTLQIFLAFLTCFATRVSALLYAT